MDLPQKSVVLMGVPAAGKTTFLGALWYALKHAPSTEVHITALPEDQKYLNLISACWLHGKPLEHTNQGARVVLSLSTGSGTGVMLCLPDASGEVYQTQWAKRQWTTEYDKLAHSSSGVAVFVHPDHVRQGALLADVAAAADILGPGAVRVGTPGAATNTPWDPLRVPAETVLVDCLQFLLGAPCYRESLKVAIIVSAWDLIQPLGKSPRVWFESELPLLAQFCKANSPCISLRCFGISAQGWKYDDEQCTKELLEKNLDPVKRIIALDGDGAPVSIATPVLWLLSALSQAS